MKGLNLILKCVKAYLEDILFVVGLILISVAMFTIHYIAGLIVTGMECIVTAVIIVRSREKPPDLNRINDWEVDNR